MKKILAAIASFILIQHATAQSTIITDGVPQSVQSAFHTQFPPSSLKKWEHRKQGYIAVFVVDGKKQYAYYTPDGKWVATESRVNRTRHLPTAVRVAWLNSGYADWYVHNIRKLETKDGHRYVMHLNNGSKLDANKFDALNEDHVLYFTKDGQLLDAVSI